MPCPLVHLKCFFEGILSVELKKIGLACSLAVLTVIKCFVCLKVFLGLLDCCLKGLLIKVWPKRSMVCPILWFASNNYLKGFSCLSRARRF